MSAARPKLVLRVSSRLVRGVTAAAVFALAILFALAVSGCGGPNPNELAIAQELAVEANRRCSEVGGIPLSHSTSPRLADSYATVRVDCNEALSPEAPE